MLKSIFEFIYIQIFYEPNNNPWSFHYFAYTNAYITIGTDMSTYLADVQETMMMMSKNVGLYV